MHRVYIQCVLSIVNWYTCVCSISSIISGPFMCVCVCMYTQKQARKEAVLIQAPTVEEDDDDNGYSLNYVQDGMLSGQVKVQIATGFTNFTCNCYRNPSINCLATHCLFIITLLCEN